MKSSASAGLVPCAEEDQEENSARPTPTLSFQEYPFVIRECGGPISPILYVRVGGDDATEGAEPHHEDSVTARD